MRQKSYRVFGVVSFCMFVLSVPCVLLGQDITIENERIKMTWDAANEGFRLKTFALKSADNRLTHVANPVGSSSFIYADGDGHGKVSQRVQNDFGFPDSSYIYIRGRWTDGLKPAALNTAGEETHFFPSELVEQREKQITFKNSFPTLEMAVTWILDSASAEDVIIEMKINVLKDGFYSFKSPLIARVPKEGLEWATVPGYVHSNQISEDFVRAYGYGHGVPALPVVVRERGAGTLAAIATTTDGLSLSVTASPGLGRDPWKRDTLSNSDWQVGLSIALDSQHVSPVVTYPVLGETGSYLRAGDTLDFRVIVSLSDQGWFPAFRHIVYDHYRLGEQLQWRRAQQSLIDRIFAMRGYLADDSTSLWRVETHNGRLIGAQEYHGGVLGAERDAMKNSDYGAMWMLANLMKDSVLLNDRLPYARNFKLEQQEVSDPFFKGAVQGQYFLWKSKRFVEEWGNYVEPIAVTYYSMLDIGNMLLFEPDDLELKERLALGAERLLDWQLPDGSWEVAYDKDSKKPVFEDLKDYRPTFYGLLVAYRILSDKRYLEAAKRGADWFYEQGVKNGYLLGVCGDTRFVPDFATAQSSQAFLDLYELTALKRYKWAAIELARIYTMSIITHPLPSDREKIVKGTAKQDWQITQAGLNFEHGGLLGSSNWEGPILLASHAGLFARITRLTGDSIFVDLARAATWGRDAFVAPTSSVASYYWKTMDRGPGPYPHHAWWQVGWITDYLIAEVELRSGGQVSFPGGFITPKVGPHKPYGFSPGTAFGNTVELFMPPNLVCVDRPDVDWIAARDVATGEVYLFLLNNSLSPATVGVELIKNKSRIENVAIEAGGLEVINIGVQY